MIISCVRIRFFSPCLTYRPLVMNHVGWKLEWRGRGITHGQQCQRLCRLRWNTDEPLAVLPGGPHVRVYRAACYQNRRSRARYAPIIRSLITTYTYSSSVYHPRLARNNYGNGHAQSPGMPPVPRDVYLLACRILHSGIAITKCTDERNQTSAVLRLALVLTGSS